MSLPKRDLLGRVSFGARIAEEEGEQLSRYFVETDQWKRIFNGDVDVVYGSKGSGKSAIYSLLTARTDELFDRGIVLAAAENPRGAPAFKDLTADPPMSEKEFVALWRIYLLCIVVETLREFGVGGKDADELVRVVEEAGLIASNRGTLQAILRGVRDYARRLLNAEAVEGGFTFDANTGMPNGLMGRITLREPSGDERRQGLVSVESLLARADEALGKAGVSIWLVLDRLDVAFADSDELEKNALRALFKVYLDLLGLANIKLKIFLRTDIWRKITEEGFREASHITRHVTIEWTYHSLLNLVIRRSLQNDDLREFYKVSEEEVLADVGSQEQFFYRMCPDQVDIGSNKPKTFDWILGRTRDGSATNAPRELIHFLSSLREQQLKMLEIGQAESTDEQIFDRAAFKAALPEVSKVRYEQTEPSRV